MEKVPGATHDKPNTTYLLTPGCEVASDSALLPSIESLLFTYQINERLNAVISFVPDLVFANISSFEVTWFILDSITYTMTLS